MVEYNTVNAKISDSKLNKLKKCCQIQTKNNFKNECQNV